jgi:hypothetical protein
MGPDGFATVNVEPLAQTLAQTWIYQLIPHSKHVAPGRAEIYQLAAYDKQERQGGPL